MLVLYSQPTDGKCLSQKEILSYQFWWHMIKWKGPHTYYYHNNCMMTIYVSIVKRVEWLGVDIISKCNVTFVPDNFKCQTFGQLTAVFFNGMKYKLCVCFYGDK